MENPKLVFDSSVEALVKVGRGRLSPSAVARIASLGVPLEGRLLPAYPAETWASVVKILCSELFPGVDPIEAQRQLAVRTVEQFADSFVGKALFTVARMMGHDRTLQRMTSNFRTGANFMQTRLDLKGPGHWELWINDVSTVPGFFWGLVEGGAKFSTGVVDDMRIKDYDGRAACTYEIRSK